MVDFPNKEKYDVQDLRLLVEILRHENGCPWDREQTHESLRRNTLEEAYEVCGAIDEDDPTHLREELGDMLLHVMFHSSIEADAERFDLDDVADAECKKLIYRHPHVFSGTEAQDAAQALESWEAIKEKERAQRTVSEAMAGVTSALPALWRAEKIQSKAARAGLELTDVHQAAQVVKEAAAEMAKNGVSYVTMGRLLYAVTNLSRLAQVDGEMALHGECERVIAQQRRQEEEELY